MIGIGLELLEIMPYENQAKAYIRWKPIIKLPIGPYTLKTRLSHAQLGNT